VFGTVATVGFYAVVLQPSLEGSLVRRYCAGHPINFAETAAFFWGVADLFLKMFDLRRQRRALGYPWFGPTTDAQPADHAESFARQMDTAPRRTVNTLIGRRLRAALAAVAARRSAERLDDHLRQLAENDADEAHGSFALVRIMAWMIPILGFLGTVIGITIAVANVTPAQLESSLSEVTGGLAVAFDTTAQALALSIILIVAQAMVERRTHALLRDVEREAEALLAHRFLPGDAQLGPFIQVVRSASEAILEHTRLLVDRQAKLWSSTVENWQKNVEQFYRYQEQRMGEMLQLIRAENKSQSESARMAGERLDTLNQELSRQTEKLAAIVDFGGQLSALETRLVDNLRAIEQAQRLDEAMHSLAAAIHLMTARYHPAPGDRTKIVA
jgi:biopolymer transport protein ExbB/TolQ